MFKQVSLLVLGLLIYGSIDAKEVPADNNSTTNVLDDNIVNNKENTSESTFGSSIFDGSFLNIKASHHRGELNTYPFGPKNTSMVCINPYLAIGNLVIDTDFSFGRSTKYAGFLRSPKAMSRITGNLADFFNNYRSFSYPAQKDFENTIGKSHFYRSYTRAIYSDNAHNIKIIAGDVATRNTIGFQKSFSGGGINISRQDGNGNVINPGLPIVVTKISKAEVRLGNEILRVKILTPGVYTVDDLGEEARLPGVTVKLSDQVSRSDSFKVDYFSGYDMPALGSDDFDLTIAFTHYWDVNDPYKMRYRNKPRFSGNYRFTPVQDITLAFGAQGFNNSYSVDLNVIFQTSLGKISPNVGFSDTYHGERAVGFGIYYALPDNEYGIHMDAMASVQSRGYGDLGISEEMSLDYDYFMDQFFPVQANRYNLFNGNSDATSSRTLMVRLYSNPIAGYTPGFTFRGDWANNYKENTNNFRDYSISLTKSPFEGCMITGVAGLTYDDPTKGRNREAPDRRLTLACCLDLNSEFSLKGTYSHLDQDRMKKYCSITYTPEAVKGLELQAEYNRLPGRSNPVFSVKYDNQYFTIKFEENISDTYEDAKANTRDGHKNNQAVIFGTSITTHGIANVQKNSFNIIRTRNDFIKAR